IYGDGSQTRSFCYVDDLVEGLIRLMKSPEGFTGPVNLGNPREFTIKQLAELAIEMTGSRSNLAYLPLPQDDPKQRQPDITLARERLDWEPTVPLREGLKHTIAYFQRLLKDSKERDRIQFGQGGLEADVPIRATGGPSSSPILI